MRLLMEVFDIIRTNHFFIKLSKCSFAQQEVEYLGHIISGRGVATEPSKIAAVTTICRCSSGASATFSAASLDVLNTTSLTLTSPKGAHSMTLAVASCLGECLLACTKMSASLSSVCGERQVLHGPGSGLRSTSVTRCRLVLTRIRVVARVGAALGVGIGEGQQ